MNFQTKPAHKAWRIPLYLLLVSVSLPAVAGCGGGNGSTSGQPSSMPATSTATAPAAQNAKVNMANYAFAPTSVTISAGGSVTWTNTDPASHTATADDQKTFDTDTVEKGKSKTVTFSKPGTYTYFCRFHPFMHGTVIVQ